MLRTAIFAGLTAAALASLSTAAFADTYTYGPYTMSKATHNGRFMTQECRIKYKLVGRPRHQHKVKVSTECHWVLPILHPIMPPKHNDHPPMTNNHPKNKY